MQRLAQSTQKLIIGGAGVGGENREDNKVSQARVYIYFKGLTAARHPLLVAPVFPAVSSTRGRTLLSLGDV